MEKPDRLNIAIGFDSRETLAYHIACNSIISKASVPVSIMPIKRSLLKGLHSRPLDHKQSNEFSFTRFLTPYLYNYKGYSIFMDSDMLVRCDLTDIFTYINPENYVSVVKHDYIPKDDIKYLNNKQYKYQKKNWSSVMVFNNEKCTALTPEYVNSASGLDLHQFKWLPDDSLIGSLPFEFNHLVSEYEANQDAKIVHYTIGIPEWYKGCEYADEWHIEKHRVNYVEEWKNDV